MVNASGQPPHSFDATQFWGIIGATARNVAAVLLAFGVIWAGMWTYIIQPQVDRYFEGKIGGLRVELGAIVVQLEAIKGALPAPRPFLEIAGTGHFVEGRKYRPGDAVTFVYLTRRNNDCPTTVKVQFWSNEANAIDNELSYTIDAVQTSPSFSFQPFSLRVRLPANMPPGFYSYAPILVPDRNICPAERALAVEPTDFFEVVP